MSHTAKQPPLLDVADPAPVSVYLADGESPFFLTCEHAGRAIPARLGTLGLAAAELDRHIAWDIGAAGVARELAQRLDAPLVLQNYSRLVVDCNRAPDADDFITPVSEATPIPGNQAVADAEREARRHEIYAPYHATISALLDRRLAAGHATVVVAVHSFTPVFHGVRRPWHIGVLHEHDPRLARALLDILQDEEQESGHLVVGDNEPYFLSELRDYSVPVHGHQRGLPHVELEIRQDLIGHAAGQSDWARRLARVLPAALDRIR